MQWLCLGRLDIKTLIKTKLLEGKYLELRSYELGKQPLKVIYCTTKNYKKCFHLKENYMILSLADQKKGKIVNTQQSQFYPYEYYKMVKFLFKPKGKIESTQLQDKTIIYKGNTAIIQ